MTFAREGLLYIALAAAIAAGGIVAAVTQGSWILSIVAVVLTLLALWVAYFFRDPDREGERGERLVISPADGRIVMITEVDEPAFLRAPSTRISIFMDVFDVHVNRYPVSGLVKYVHYNKGKFINAATDKASLDNEQLSVGIESGANRVLVRQIAGLIARRIVNYSRVGAMATQGERMGIIRFGSRVDVFIPTDATLRVTVGESQSAGSTVLAELPA
jgi:phosphatidylserine decarboxylase